MRQVTLTRGLYMIARRSSKTRRNVICIGVTMEEREGVGERTRVELSQLLGLVCHVGGLHCVHLGSPSLHPTQALTPSPHLATLAECSRAMGVAVRFKLQQPPCGTAAGWPGGQAGCAIPHLTKSVHKSNKSISPMAGS